LFRRLLIKAIASFYLKRPEVAELIEARYQSWGSMFFSGLNLMSFQLRREKIFRLTSVMLELTNQCNLKCMMCPVNRSMERARGFMSFDLFRRIIDDNPGLEYVLLYNWGEPFLHPDIFKMIEYAADRGIRPNTTSNGTLLTPDMIEKIAASRLDRLTISMDGLPESYEKIRGVSYEKVEQNLTRLIQRRNETKSNVKIDLGLSLFEENEQDVQAFRERWKNRVDRIQIQPRTYMNEGEIPPQARRTRRCDEIWRGNLVVLWDGTVAPCCVDFEGVLAVGDANTQRLRDIVNGPEMRRLRRNLNRGKFVSRCATCVEYSTPIVKPRFDDHSS